MKKLPVLLANDVVEIIAPASRCLDSELLALKNLFESWQLKTVIAEDLFGEDLLCANSDVMRLHHLKNALQNPQTKAVVCARGGYGSMRLLPELAKLTPIDCNKIFVGMSDTTALQLFLQQTWQWPTIHGAAAPSRFSAESIASLKAVLFGDCQQVEFIGMPLNSAATMNHSIHATVIGGNLTLIQAGIGTFWQLNGHEKIILLEETGERGYRVDRMLEHLWQANILNDAAAIVVADFIGGKEPDGSSLIKPVLARFAERCSIPVVQIEGVGHDYINYPVPLGTEAVLQLGDEIRLICSR